ncbi:adenylate/guanylate cyclase domain-containing protein [Almyronema epifaneia S1]|uniref:Adenylate/guanylate cyclase domain-containing protein n=1 Tax=Almyronema epifaneia S1 TaxID=2991925 RepID=A0ABW6IEK2_9CYAN
MTHPHSITAEPLQTPEAMRQEIEVLRQQVQQLQAEISDRDCQLNKLTHQKALVEQRFQDQTAALRESNDTLIGEVVERRQVEEALRAAKDQLQAILEAVPGIVSWISADLRYLGVNQHLAKTFGMPPEAFVGQDIGFLDTSQEFIGFVRNFFASPQLEACCEIDAVVGGIGRSFLIVAQKYNHGKAAFTVGIDITERNQAEEGLRQAEAKYRNIFENIVEGIFQSTRDGRYISANPALARIYGYASVGELMLNITNIQHQLYVEPGRRHEFIRTMQTQDAIVGFESEIYRKDGTRIWISENARAVRDKSGKLLYYEGTVQDITARKQAEIALQQANEELEQRVLRRTAALTDTNRQLLAEINERHRIEQALRDSEAELRALFAAMTDVITVFDSEGRYLNMVATNSALLYRPDQERVGRTVYEVLPPYQANLFMRSIHRALNTKQPVRLEYNLPVGDWHQDDQNGGNAAPDDFENTAWYTAIISPMPDKRVIWVARDITERRRTDWALQAEQQKSERLLLNILPRSIAEELKQNPSSIAYRFEEATILFADIVNFTGLSASMPPTALVDLLNEIFSTFDQLAAQYRLEKIKTIGDAYMVVGGLPDPDPEHPEAIAAMALEMQAAIAQIQRTDGHPFNLRIGIDMGPVVAGVIGIRKFSYDLWGDAVNVASRMESQGIAGKIQVTEAVYRRLQHRYHFEQRGEIKVKGRGQMMTYWLLA